MTAHHKKADEKLVQALMSFRTEEECRAFLEDLCTIKELQDMIQRFDTAILLSQGKNYQEISAQVGISTATISRINRCIQYGSGGYRDVIEKVSAKEAADSAE